MSNGVLELQNTLKHHFLYSTLFAFKTVSAIQYTVVL